MVKRIGGRSKDLFSYLSGHDQATNFELIMVAEYFYITNESIALHLGPYSRSQ